jgi:hypothetical protein
VFVSRNGCERNAARCYASFVDSGNFRSGERHQSDRVNCSTRVAGRRALRITLPSLCIPRVSLLSGYIHQHPASAFAFVYRRCTARCSCKIFWLGHQFWRGCSILSFYVPANVPSLAEIERRPVVQPGATIVPANGTGPGAEPRKAGPAPV